MFSLRPHLFLLFIAPMVCTSLTGRAEPAAEPLETTPQTGADVIPVDEILALNATMRSMVDLFVKPIPNKEHRAQALYNLMFSLDKFALKYDNSLTKTAIETIESGSGNCVSLANAFVAMARYAGLNVSYLDVRVPESWRRESDVYYQLKHVSAVVKISRRAYLGIEYQWLAELKSARQRIVDDQKAFAVFYSNRGIELLTQDKIEAAVANLEHSVKLDPDSANNWSNLGVAYRRLNRLDEAEQAYLQALKQDKSDLTTLNNLAILYQMTGRANLAAKYHAKLERYRMQNPFYLIDLAKDEIKAGNHETALKYANKAIAKYDDEHEFYFVAAQIYALQGDTQKAAENLQKAEQYALTAMTRNLYARKLELLGTTAPARN